MPQYDINFFDRSLRNIHHDSVNTAPIDDDYISLNASSVKIGRTDAVAKGSYIYITGDAMRFFGVVSDTDNGANGITTVSFKPFLSLLDIDVLFDTDWQGGGSALETVLAGLISDNFVSTGDSLQNLPLTITTTSSTTVWGYGLKSDTENKHHCIVGLYGTLLVKAMTGYGIAVEADVNFLTRSIALTIGTIAGVKHIDADMPNVVVKTFKVKKASTETNKVIIWNTANYTDSVTYYLHSDGSYDTTDSDRIEPVVMSVKAAEAGSDSTFADAAASTAASELGGIEWSNLIELEVSENDTLISPLQLHPGQTVYIYHDGVRYTSILTGRKIDSNIVTLSFGTIRTKLTKQLKMQGRI